MITKAKSCHINYKKFIVLNFSVSKPHECVNVTFISNHPQQMLKLKVWNVKYSAV